jgi:hypothetical protein
MKQPPSPNQNVTSEKTKIILVIIFLAILLLALGILVGLVLRRSGFQLSLPAVQTQTIPTVFVPTADCSPATLVLGTTTFQIQNLAPASDSSLTVPADTSDIAYWVEGTNNNYVFVLSPTPNNLALQTALKAGDLVAVFWADCTTVSFAVSAIEASQLSDPALLDQSISGMSVFVQTDPSTAGFVVKGELPEETVDVLDTPRPDESGILAEVSLLETSTSPDGTIKVGISVRNYGQTAFTISLDDVSLTPQDAAPLVLVSSRPRLPEELKPGETEIIEFTFPRPSSQTATLKIFTVEYDIEGY